MSASLGSKAGVARRSQLQHPSRAPPRPQPPSSATTTTTTLAPRQQEQQQQPQQQQQQQPVPMERLDDTRHESVELSFVDLEYEEDDGSVGFRLLFPCSLGGGGSGGGGGAEARAKPPAPQSWWLAPRWNDALPQYAHGYATVAFFGGTSLKSRALRLGVAAVLWAASAAWALPLRRGRPLAAAPRAAAAEEGARRGDKHRLPVLVFSHGACSNRHTYTTLACEIARRVPCVVACVEHADGTAASARLPGGGGRARAGGAKKGERWMYFRGLGKGDALESKGGVRTDEVRLTVRALEALDRGQGGGGGAGGRVWRLGAGPPAAAASSSPKAAAAGDPVLASFAGRLDLAERLAVAGHSCGGATAAAVAADPDGLPGLSAAVAIDPWWPMLHSARPPLAAAAAAAAAAAPPAPSASSPPAASPPPPSAPLLVLGSHTWQTPSLPDGGMMCDADRQRRVLDVWTGRGGAAKTAPPAPPPPPPPPPPPGALLVVPRGSGHHSFSDVALLVERSRLLRYLRSLMGASHPELTAAESIEMSGWTVARFLRDRWRWEEQEEEEAGGDGAGARRRRPPRPVSAAELDAYRAFFGERLAILEAHV
jgi:hypothetical protein